MTLCIYDQRGLKRYREIFIFLAKNDAIADKITQTKRPPDRQPFTLQDQDR
jgi:hypothetical protein